MSESGSTIETNGSATRSSSGAKRCWLASMSCWSATAHSLWPRRNPGRGRSRRLAADLEHAAELVAQSCVEHSEARGGDREVDDDASDVIARPAADELDQRDRV